MVSPTHTNTYAPLVQTSYCIVTSSPTLSNASPSLSSRRIPAAPRKLQPSRCEMNWGVRFLLGLINRIGGIFSVLSGEESTGRDIRDGIAGEGRRSRPRWLGLGRNSHLFTIKEIYNSAFYRGRFSARIQFTDITGTNPRGSVTFLICGHDMQALESEKAGFKGWQPFIDVQGTLPLSPLVPSSPTRAVITRPKSVSYHRYPLQPGSLHSNRHLWR